MLVLALETTLEIASCAVWDGERKSLLAELKAYAYQTLTQRLPALVQTTLESSEVKLQDIGLIAVSLGPGSFTSVRVGLAFAKGLSMALDKAIIGIRTMEALALSSSVHEGSLLVTLYPSRPSRPTEVYAAFFHFRNGTMERVGNEFASEFSQLVSMLRVRPEDSIVFVGTLPPGAISALSDLRREKQVALPLLPSIPSASLVALRAWQKWEQSFQSDDPVSLVPVYVLPSSAESRFGITVSMRDGF
ncbi:MAG: tRNA (adenosine(37)-N6)-threonylcarbamoyltransferase complex dimerization subunit type 1 TsaB [Armatimonadetes bacterium]|nr:tRNA (adenosine(37)-N6)-threonylcarbamoyltransferase complex dimerization subunit type 1 TsaB [Armatimonadota bacterium]